MRSPRCDRRLVRLAALTMVACMLFGLFGCSAGTAPEEAAERYLEKKYGEDFQVGTLRRKEGGPFLDENYTGSAWAEGRPMERFSVWVSSDGKTVKDARYTVELLPAINDWVAGHAAGIWESAETAVVVDALSHNAGADYGTGDFLRFYREESVDNTVVLVLANSTDLYDRFCRFHDALDGTMTGYINLYIAEEGNMDPETLFDTKPDVQIMIGSVSEVILEKLQGL